MKINEAIITYYGRQARVICDRNCRAAWGVSSRPYKRLSDNIDDVVYLSDSELDEAPENPGTYEGDEGKPLTPDCFPTKWCIRECERSVLSEPDKINAPLQLIDWNKRHPRRAGDWGRLW